MKKILMISAVSLLVIAGCKDASVKVSDESQAILKVGNKEVTKGQLASSLNGYKFDATIEIIKNDLYNEYVPVTEEVTNKVNSELEDLKKRVTTSSITWEDSLKSAGTTEEEYKTNVLLPSVRANLLAKKYLETTFTERVEQFKPIKLMIFSVSDAEKAQNAVKAINEGKTFTEAFNEFTSNAQATLNGSEILTFNGEGIVDEMVLQEAYNSQENEVKYFTASNNSFFVYKVVAKDATTFKDEAINKMLSSSTIIKDSLSYYLNEKKVEIYDIDVYTKFEKEYKKAIKNTK